MDKTWDLNLVIPQRARGSDVNHQILKCHQRAFLPTAEVKKEVEESSESDEDMGFGLFD